MTAHGWPQEAALRMLQNNLDPDVAEHPDELVVYGGTGKAARNWASFDAGVPSSSVLPLAEALAAADVSPEPPGMRVRALLEEFAESTSI